MFVYVKDSNVELVRVELPKAFGNVSGFDMLSSAEQITMGWYPLIEGDKTFDANFETLENPTYTIGANDVTSSYVKTEKSLADAKLAIGNQIDALRATSMDSGVTYNGNSYDSDGVSRGNISGTVGSVAAGLTLPSGFVWRTADNINVAFSPSDINALGQIMLDHVNACYNAGWAHKLITSGMSDVATIKAYDITTGWPA